MTGIHDRISPYIIVWWQNSMAWTVTIIRVFISSTTSALVILRGRTPTFILEEAKRRQGKNWNSDAPTARVCSRRLFSSDFQFAQHDHFRTKFAALQRRKHCKLCFLDWMPGCSSLPHLHAQLMGDILHSAQRCHGRF